MCRLLGVVASPPRPADWYLVGAPKSLAWQSLRGQRAPHRDGFGYAVWQDGLRVRRWGKEELAAFPGGLPPGPAEPVAALIAHVRKASPEFRDQLTADQAHPFPQADFALAHNGGIRDADKLDPAPGIDSQKLARWLARTWRPRSPEGLARALAKLPSLICDYSAVNLLLLTQDALYAFCHYRRQPDYYSLWYRREPGAVVVGSEPLDHSPGWQRLEDGQLLHIPLNLELQPLQILP